MTRRGPVRVGAGIDRSDWPLTIAAVSFLTSAAVGAEPYQSDLRSKFSTEAPGDRIKPGASFEARIESALMLIGNINLAEDSADEIDTAGIEAAPGLYASYFSPRAQGEIDYSLIGRAFEESDYDSITHRLAANGNAAIVQDLLYIAGQAGYGQSVIDPSRSFNYGNNGLFDQQNLTDTANVSVMPYLSKEWSEVQFDASYSYGRVWYLNDDDFSASDVFTNYNEDSEDQSVKVSLRTREAIRDSSLKATYEWQGSDFDRSLPYRYERAGIEASLRLARTLNFVADGGLETDLVETTTEGGLDSEYWHLGLRWQPDDRNYIDARYGDRFFGDSYRVEAMRKVRLLTMRLSYTEDPEVETRRVNSEFDPNPPVPPLPGGGFSAFNAEPFVRKDARFVAVAEGRRTNIRLDVYDLERDYIRALLTDEQTTGAMLNVTRDFGSDLYGELQARYEDIERGVDPLLPVQPIAPFRDYDRDLMLRLNWEAYVNFLASIESGWLKRSGDTNYDGLWLAFRLRYTF